MKHIRKDISVVDMSEKIVDRILEERYLNKENLMPIVQSVLKVFMPKLHAPVPQARHLTDKSITKHIFSTVLLEATTQYWKSIVRELSPESMDEHYVKVDAIKEKIKEQFA